MEYLLNQLVPWTRRTAGDEITRTTETVISDGSRRFTLQSDGQVTIVELDVDLVQLATDKYSNIGNVITLVDVPLEGDQIDVFFDNARFTDQQIIDGVSDGSRFVQSDVKAQWFVDPINYKITDDGTQGFFDTKSNPITSLVSLVVLRSAIAIYDKKAMSAGDDAIMIKDGDTTINTSLTAKSTEAVMKRLRDQYMSALKQYRSEAFVGVGTTDDSPPFSAFPAGKDWQGNPLYPWPTAMAGVPARF